ncbi:indole-3-pyruvate decarboxylase [Streptomyces camponoticapitis]|uniref:Alpha-keto-acid decarboxylase n=1 Tax=Streptomyces camponoticapitis TaxID=1616125 RepID=A0ABQ2ET21_9ACTN|nr:thiamine pyrophosphate-binding protein [Streptomyces camponoticapitis]GGK25033.1 indole-3-pyruvate decarboxylase [Streptomyces camponoticapitis]
MTTVIQHVLNRLQDIGVKHVFGVPGDYAFPINDAIAQHPDVEWVGNCNELNAAYCADGYARVHGVGAVCTTYGVGELSAICGIAGAYTEHVPLFHLVGMPQMGVQAHHSVVHHTLGDGEFNLFEKLSGAVVCASAIMTPQNTAAETERLIAAALYHRRPVYMAFPSDLASMPVVGEAQPHPTPASDPRQVDVAVQAISDMLGRAKSSCVLPGVLLARAGLEPDLQQLLDATGMPFATMMSDKGVLNEDQLSFVGMYDGKLMNEDVRRFVEDSDVVILGGTLMNDFNTGAFTTNLDPGRLIDIRHHYVRVDGMTYQSVEMKDLLNALAEKLPHKQWPQPSAEITRMAPAGGSGDDPITAATLYPRWERFLKPNDVLIAETGTASMGMAFARLPAGATFHNQTLWGSIGWATPAAVGAAVAAKDSQRVVLITGEGSHQLTAQEISQFGRNGLHPVVFVINNNGYLIERLLCADGDIAYNDIADWRYSELPKVLGCEGWYTARVTTIAELDHAMDTAANADTGCYVEVVTGTYEAPPLLNQLHNYTATLYST